MLLLGREVGIPGEIRSDRDHDNEGHPIKSYGEYVDWFRDRMQVAHDIARERLEKAAKRHK